MTKTIKLAVAMSMVALMPFGVQAGGDACAAQAAGTCPASKEACAAEKTAGTCPAANTTCEAQTAGYMKVSYQVDGMTCGGCATAVTKALNAIEGVKDVSACADSKQAKLALDPKKVKDAQVVAAIEKAGFKVSSELIQVNVNGLSCEACSSKVSNALTKVSGVKEQKVCHVGKNAVVTFDPKKVSREQILAAIDETGFKVVQ